MRFPLSEEERQIKLRQIVDERGVSFKEAKNILHEKNFREKETRIAQKKLEKKEQQQAFLAENPEYIFDNIILNCNVSALKTGIEYDETSESEESNSDNSDSEELLYEQYIPHIFEEVRTILYQSWFEINPASSEARNRNFPIQIKDFHLNTWEDGKPNTFTARAQYYPKTDFQGISSLALLFMDERNKLINGGRIVLASFSPDNSLDFSGKYSSEFEMNSLHKGKRIFAYLLGSLVSYRRMYVACKKNYLNFQTQITLAKADYFNIHTALHATRFSDLNQNQATAVSAYIAAPPGLYMLQGPPGTGKTTTICTLLKYLYQNNKSALVTAPSNKAVQVIAKQFLKLVENPIIILVGVSDKVDPELEDIFLDKIIENLFKLKNNLDKLFYQLSPENLLYLSKGQTPENKFSKLIEKIEENINNLSRYGYLNEIEKFIEFTDERIATMQEGIEPFLSNLDDQLNSDTRQLRWLSEYRQNQQALQKIVTTLSFQDVENEILSAAWIVFGTLSTCGRQNLINAGLTFDHLIIDEAAQALIPEILIPLWSDPAHCLMVGDHQQLPATVLSQKNKTHGFDASLMHKMRANRSGMYKLTEQYRMHPNIRQWPSFRYYHNRLTDSKNVLDRKSIISKNIESWCKPCTFYDVTSGKESSSGVSYSNDQEIYFIAQLIAMLNKNGIENRYIGIIAFYALQVEKLTQILSKQLKISTVDGFQGSENDIIIISFVRANRTASVGFLNDSRRLNVAVTRGKHAVLMVGHKETLKNSDSADLSALIRNLEERDLILDASQIELNHWRPKTKPAKHHNPTSPKMFQHLGDHKNLVSHLDKKAVVHSMPHI